MSQSFFIKIPTENGVTFHGIVQFLDVSYQVTAFVDKTNGMIEQQIQAARLPKHSARYGIEKPSFMYLSKFDKDIQNVIKKALNEEGFEQTFQKYLKDIEEAFGYEDVEEDF